MNNKKKFRSLGSLLYMKIWHDNSGKGDHASWFLNYIIVHDLQTREKFYFICQEWLAVEKSDGKIERELFVACEPQKSEINYNFQKNAKYNVQDSHIWISVFKRPVQSSFSRLDRITCCFVLLYLTMLISMAYSETSTDSKVSHTKLDAPFVNVTLDQVTKLNKSWIK